MSNEKQAVLAQSNDQEKPIKKKLNKKIVGWVGVPALILNTINLHLYSFGVSYRLNKIILCVVLTLVFILALHAIDVFFDNKNIELSEKT